MGSSRVLESLKLERVVLSSLFIVVHLNPRMMLLDRESRGPITADARCTLYEVKIIVAVCCGPAVDTSISVVAR